MSGLTKIGLVLAIVLPIAGCCLLSLGISICCCCIRAKRAKRLAEDRKKASEASASAAA